jgi:hypothetical protein
VLAFADVFNDDKLWVDIGANNGFFDFAYYLADTKEDPGSAFKLVN